MKIFGFDVKWGTGGKSKETNVAPGVWEDPFINVGIKGGTMTGDPVVIGTVMPTDADQAGIGFIQRDVSRAQYDELYHLAKYNHDVSFAVSNIVELANTDLTIDFDTSVNPKQAAKMMAELSEVQKIWYEGGLPMLVNALLRQVAITGVISGEAKPRKDLKGVGNVTLLSPKWLWFTYDIPTSSYKAYQQSSVSVLNTSAIWNNYIGYHPLSTKTYKYIAVSRDEDYPYGIPPILAALRAICIEDDMLDNLAAITKRLGLFGFLQVVVNAPSRGKKADGSPETDDDYVARVQSYIASLEPEVEKGLSNGYVISAKQVDGTGTERKTDFTMTASTNDSAGAAGLMELIMQIKSAGLKQDPIFLGKNFSTTESLAKVLIKKFSGQLMDYQEGVAQFLEHCYTLHLRLLGYKFKWVNVSFEPPIMEDTKTRYEGLATKYNYYKGLFDQGIINQQQLAQFMGFNEPFQDGPPVAAPVVPIPVGIPQTGEATPTDSSQNNKESQAFEKTESMEMSAKSLRRFQYFVKHYNKDSMNNLMVAAQFVTKRIVDIFYNLSPGSDLEEIKGIVKNAALLSWHTAFTLPQSDTSKKWVEESFSFFRMDKAIFQGKRKNPDGVRILPGRMTSLESRTIKNFQNTDIVTLGAVIFDGSMIDRINSVLDEFAGRSELPFGDETPVKFISSMLKVIQGNSGEVVKITTTTLANIRAVAAIYYLEQTGFHSYEISTDKALACSNCAPTVGKVTDAFDRICGYIRDGNRECLMPPVSLVAGLPWSTCETFETCKCKVWSIF